MKIKYDKIPCLYCYNTDILHDTNKSSIMLLMKIYKIKFQKIKNQIKTHVHRLHLIHSKEEHVQITVIQYILYTYNTQKTILINSYSTFKTILKYI